MLSLSRADVRSAGSHPGLHLWRSIHWHRLALAVALTFVVADTYPHPRLAPGIVVQGLEWLRHTPAVELPAALEPVAQPPAQGAS